MSRSNLVGRNVVAQLGIVRRIFRIPRQVFAGELPLDQVWIFGEEKNTSLQPDPVRPLFNFDLVPGGGKRELITVRLKSLRNLFNNGTVGSGLGQSPAIVTRSRDRDRRL